MMLRRLTARLRALWDWVTLPYISWRYCRDEDRRKNFDER